MAYGLASIPNMSGGIGAGILQAGKAWGAAFADYGESRAEQNDEKFTKDLLAGITRQREEKAAQIDSLENWENSDDAKRVQKRIDAMDNAHLELVEKMENMEGGLTGWAANVPKSLKLQQGLKNLKEEYARRKGEASQQLLALKETPMNYQAALDQAMAANPNVSQEAWGRGLLSISNLQQHESSTRTMGSREKVAHNQATRSDQLVDSYDPDLERRGKVAAVESQESANQYNKATMQSRIDATNWRAKAAEQGFEATTLELKKLRESMAPMDQNLLKSIESGTLDAATMASIPPSQMQKAMSWYRVKIDLGNMKTQAKLAELKEREGPAVQPVDIRAINTLMSEASDEVKRIDKQMDVFRNTASLAHGADARVNSMIDSHKAEMAKLQKEMDAAKKEYKTYQQQLMWKVPSAFDGATVRFNGQLWNSTGGKWVKVNQ